MKYRKKPVVIEANQLTIENAHALALWSNAILHESKFIPEFLIIHTLEGDHKAEIGDWIIKGVNGEFYPCKPDIFEKTYEKVGN